MKSLFSLDWFKSERQIELEILKVKEQELKNKRLEKEVHNIGYTPEGHINVAFTEKLYTSLKLTNDVLTIVLNDGSVLSKSRATVADFNAIKQATNENDILFIMSSSEGINARKEEAAVIKKAETLNRGLNSLTRFSDFIVKDNSLYMVGAENRSIPQLLVEKFLEVVENNASDTSLALSEEYSSLKKFWLKCCLNPNAQSAEDLYVFLAHHQFKIDNHGNFYAYRRVVSKNGQDNDLVDFISNTYNKIKAVWKKKPSNYEVTKFGEVYSFEPTKSNNLELKGEWIGNLEELYLNISNMSSNSYTSAHTGMEDYRVGSVISMPRNEGDDNNQMSCSKGFHAASKEYDYSGFGDTPILVIINPMDVLSVPIGEVGKLRTCRWFFAMTLTKEEEYILDDLDFDVAELGDIFEEQCELNLESYVHNSFTEEVKRHTFTIPQMSHLQIKTIVKSLDEMKNEIKKRVQKIV
jgi:hypothetical protein